MGSRGTMLPSLAAPTRRGRRFERAMRLDQTDRRHSIWFFFGGFAELLLGRTENCDRTAPEILGTQCPATGAPNFS